MSNIVQRQVTKTKITQTGPTVPPNNNSVPDNNDIVEFKIKIPRYYYNLFSQFAKFLHDQPQQHPQTGEIMKDPKTGKPIPSLPAPDIATYFVTCAFNTYQSYQMIVQMSKQQQNPASK